MQPRDLFGVSVRFVGLISCLYGVYDLFFVGVQLTGMELHDDYPAGLVIVTAAFFLVLGFALIRSVEWLVRLAYGPAQPPTSIFP
jgi:hypothetical protein